MALLKRGKRNRFTAATAMNELSSRSHALFIVVVEQRETAYVNSNGDGTYLSHYFIVSQ